MISREEAAARVARGAAHLDQVRPGWERRIDVGTLTLHDPCGCIVGQLCRNGFYGFADGFRSLGLDNETVRWCGMQLEAEDCDPAAELLGRDEYMLLQDAWIAEIARRLHPDTTDLETPLTTSVSA